MSQIKHHTGKHVNEQDRKDAKQFFKVLIIITIALLLLVYFLFSRS